MSPSLRRLFLLLFLPTAALVMAGAALYGQSEVDREITRLRSQERLGVSLGAEALSHNLEAVTRDLHFLSSFGELRAALDAPTPENLEHLAQHFIHFSRAYRIYDQLRWIDETGMERVRVDYNEGRPAAIPADKLQDKSKRYFFRESVKLGANEVFVSPLDLNIEHDRIEVPHKPMVRVATPVFDGRGKKRGIVIINYYGRVMLDAFAEATSGVADRVMVMNGDGYWLKSPNPGEEWGFMFKRPELTLAARSPAAWARMRAADEGQETLEDGLWTWETVYPLLAGQKSCTGAAEPSSPGRGPLEMREYRWKVATRLSGDALMSMKTEVGLKLTAVVMLLLGLLGFGCWKLAENRERLRTTIDTALDAVVGMDSGGRITGWNTQAENIFGWRRDEAIGRLLHETIVPPHLRDAHIKGKRRFLSTGVTTIMGSRIETLAQHRDGREFPVELAISSIKVGHEREFSAFIRDISDRKKAEEEIRELAFYDTLTRLPNRRLFLDRLHQALAISDRSGKQGAILLVDLDDFKNINDTQGHAVGDLVLIEVAERLRAGIQEGDTIARLGSDEFIVLVEDLDADEPAAAAQAEAMGEKILAAVERPYIIHGIEHHTSASIGITLFRGGIKTTAEMLKRADIALHHAKDRGNGTLGFFDPALQVAVMARVALESDLRRAIALNQFLLHYQPQVDSSGRAVGAEALVRWQHPERGMVSPVEFIPLAEETGLILPLGHWILSTACAQLKAWAGRPETAHLTLSVNISGRQFKLPTFVEEVLSLIDHHGIDPARLKLEITESMLLDDVDEVVAKMDALKARGITFSMDDFGTGYSSLSYLKRLPLYQLKIDQSFVRDVLVDPNDASIARTIIMLGQSLGLTVVAEGVETEAQMSFLAVNGCHNFQGYLFSRPVPAADLEHLLESGTGGRWPDHGTPLEPAFSHAD